MASIQTSDRGARRTTAGLLAAAAVGSVAGVVIPTWAVEYENGAAALGTVFALMTTMSVLVVVAAASARRVLRGVLFVICSLAISAVLWAVTWFTVTPGMVSALWLIGSAVIVGEQRYRRLLITVGVMALLIATFCSLYLVQLFPNAGDLLGSVTIGLVSTVLAGLAVWVGAPRKLDQRSNGACSA